MDRRRFLTSAAAALAGLMCGGGQCTATPTSEVRRRRVESAAVLWYSQTGNARRIGRVIAKALELRGVRVDAGELGEFDLSRLPACDLIVVGCPVYYMNVPKNVLDRLRETPALDGIPAASFVTFGGPGDNQHNTAARLLLALTARGAAPVGLATFGAISTFAPTWSMGNAERTLAYRDRPNQQTYAAAETFAAQLLENTAEGRGVVPKIEFEAAELVLPLAPAWWTKLLIGRHEHDRAKCIRCGACVKTCPVGAVSIDPHRIDTGACIACFGCVNNCPADAIDMRFMRTKVVGYRTFARQQGIDIPEPAILAGS